MTLLLLVVVVLALVVAGAVAFARTERRKFERDNQVVPGISGRAPASWAGAHTPEAKLHRRLRDAVAAVSAMDDGRRPGLSDAKRAFEQQALAVDDRLVAVAALPERVKAEPLAQVAGAVEAVEDAAASLVAAANPALEARSELDAAMAQMNERLDLLAEAYRELDEPGTA